MVVIFLHFGQLRLSLYCFGFGFVQVFYMDIGLTFDPRSSISVHELVALVLETLGFKSFFFHNQEFVTCLTWNYVEDM